MSEHLITEREITMKRITLFSGHFGSGKTNVAVNYAMKLARLGLPTAAVDLDTVNPYFRTKDSEKELTQAGIRVISLPFANTNVDLPTVPSEVYSVLRRHDEYAVFDIGGDDDGAYALGGFAPIILEENNFEHLFVVNFHRPLTPDENTAAEYMTMIERACGIPFTGIVNNSNLGEETTAEHVLSTADKALRLAKKTGIPVVMTSAETHIAEKLGTADIFPLKLQKKYW